MDLLETLGLTIHDIIQVTYLINEATNAVVRRKIAMPDVYEYSAIMSEFRLHLLKVLLGDPCSSLDEDRSTYYGVHLPRMGQDVGANKRREIIQCYKNMFQHHCFAGDYSPRKYQTMCQLVAEYLHTGPVKTPRTSCHEDTRALPYAMYKPQRVSSCMNVQAWKGGGIAPHQTVSFRIRQPPYYAFAYVSRLTKESGVVLRWLKEEHWLVHI